jgi:hypothetical protein
VKLSDYEKQIGAALRARDPVAAVRALHPDVDGDGVRLTALLVARLRFERLLRGSPDAEAWFERDPASFTRAFARYHAEVPPRAFFPAAEAALFAGWRERAATPLPARSRIVAPRRRRKPEGRMRRQRR